MTMMLVTVTLIISIGLGFSLSYCIVSGYLKKSNDFGNDFGEIYDVIQSSLKVTEKKDKINRP